MLQKCQLTSYLKSDYPRIEINSGRNVKHFTTTITEALTTFTFHNSSQYQGSQPQCNYNRNLKPSQCHSHPLYVCMHIDENGH